MRTVTVDLAAIRDNYLQLKALVAPSKVMAVVKANAYGHGMVEVAKALEQIGVDVIGVADFDEAVALREAGIKSRIMCWLLSGDTDYSLAQKRKIELGISTFDQLDSVLPETVLHIKIDTGLGRNGFTASAWPEVFSRLRGNSDVQGILSHLSNTSEKDDFAQKKLFDQAVAMASDAGIDFAERHLAATAGAISYPDFRYEMVRCGIGIYGLNPFEDKPIGLPLKPAMRASSELVNIKRVEAGQGVSYGYLFVSERPTNLGLVPFGYAEGMPRVSKGHRVWIQGNLFPVVGRVAMDQFVVDLGDSEFPLGTEVVIFGQSDSGEPSAEDLAATAGTVNYEIVTRIGGRAKRVYQNR